MIRQLFEDTGVSLPRSHREPGFVAPPGLLLVRARQGGLEEGDGGGAALLDGREGTFTNGKRSAAELLDLLLDGLAILTC